MAIGIAYVDGPRLARSMYAAADWVSAGRDEINRLNVFPVPDGDTGTNFSLTLRAVADACRALGDAPLSTTAQTMARGAVLGARGNSGMMLAHFLLGFSEGIGAREVASAREIAGALRKGAAALYASLDEPREGTILTVARAAAVAAERAAVDSPDISVFMTRMLAEGEISLARTPELLAVLKEAGVVDAGGKGFVRMLEGVVRFIHGDPILPAPPGVPEAYSFPAADVTVAAERDFQFCTEFIARGEQLPPANEVRAAMHQFGGSVVVAVVADILKVHVHTDTPEAVFTYAGRWGELTFTKADDMRAQHLALQHLKRRPVAVVTDTSADLPDAVLDRHHIALVPLQVLFGDAVFQDRVGIKPEEFYRRLRAARELPTTSQPTPGDFVRVFRSALEEADDVLAVLLGSGLSGTFQAAQAAVRAAGLERVHLFDSRSATLGLGLLALRAAELAESGWKAAEIANELERVRRQSGVLLTVDTYDNLIRSGRVSKGKAWLAGMLDVKPILSLDQTGRIVPVDRVRGRDAVVTRILALVEKQLTPRPKAIRFGVVHAEAPEVAERVRTALIAAYRPRDCFVALATGVLGTHVGLGAWALCWQVEDGTPTGPSHGVAAG
ncbi:MAG: DegV family EDD domain-containing protein [Gemmatimonadales bacterium]|nr:DegV family EDD domain-containing protein [Gemmatimonadales bacterium]